MISTIEVAKRLGITCMAVNKRIKKLEIEKIKRGVYAYVNEEDFNRIAQLPKTPSEHSNRDLPTPTSSPREVETLREQLEFLQKQLREKDRAHLEQLQLLRKQMENERFTASHQLQEKEKMLMEAVRERAELRVLLFREQELHLETQKEVKAIESSPPSLENQTISELQDWIEFLEATHQTFVDNIKLLNSSSTPPLIVHEGGKTKNQSFYTKFAK